MSKLTTIIFLLSLCIMVNSQESEKKVLNKKGDLIGPEKGDWSIGVDADPFLNYIGNFIKLSNAANNAPKMNFSAKYPGSISVKKFISDNKALRGALKIGITQNTEFDGNAVDADKTDSYSEKGINIGINIGIEHSLKMKSRLRGYYGYECFVSKTPYQSNSYIDAASIVTGKYSYIDGDDENNNFYESGGNTISIGIGGIIGVEYFIASKISIGGEFGVALSYSSVDERIYKPKDSSLQEVKIDMGEAIINLINYSKNTLSLNLYF